MDSGSSIHPHVYIHVTNMLQIPKQVDKNRVSGRSNDNIYKLVNVMSQWLKNRPLSTSIITNVVTN